MVLHDGDFCPLPLSSVCMFVLLILVKSTVSNYMHLPYSKYISEFPTLKIEMALSSTQMLHGHVIACEAII